MRKEKKAFISIIQAVLLLLLIVTASTVLYSWLLNTQSEWVTTLQIQEDIRGIQILAIKRVNSTTSIIGLKNKGVITTYNVQSVFLDELECIPLGNNTILSIASIQLNCSVTIGETYSTVVYTDKGVFEKLLTVYET